MCTSPGPPGTLGAQWYNAVTDGLGLDPLTFQLVQDARPLGGGLAELWAYLDALPLQSLVLRAGAARPPGFAQTYGALVTRLARGSRRRVRQARGDSEAAWIAYLRTLPPLSPTEVAECYARWTRQHDRGPDGAGGCGTAVQPGENGVLGTAVRMLSAAESAGAGFAYTATYGTLFSLLAQAPAADVRMDSAFAPAGVGRTWADAPPAVPCVFAGSDAAARGERFAAGGVCVRARFGRVAVLSATPLARLGDDPALAAFTPWFHPPALSLAFRTPDEGEGRHGSLAWESTFGPAGTLRRLCTGLLVADSLQLEVASGARFAPGERDALAAAAAEGAWPLLPAHGSTGWRTRVEWSPSGCPTVHAVLPPGNPLVLGRMVVPVSELV